jgi:hypothetical protein
MKSLSKLIAIPAITILFGISCSEVTKNNKITLEVRNKEIEYINLKNKITENKKEDYTLLKGKILECKNKNYVTRIADRNLDGRTDNYEIRNTNGEIILSYFRDFRKNKIYSKCIFFGKILDGRDIELEDNKLEQFNYILKNPKKYGFEKISEIKNNLKNF